MSLPSIYDLDKINNYQTDKLGKGNIHNYGSIYEHHLNTYRTKEIVFWEIGVDRGDSLRMWSDYFPNATIIGIDIKEPTLPNFTLPNRTHFFKVNINDVDSIKAIIDKYKPDIVLDDESHKDCDMRIAFDTLFPHTTYLYMIEDFGTQYLKRHGRSFINKRSYALDIQEKCDSLVCLENVDVKRICWEKGIVVLYKG